jgi:hypothetical protein
MKLFSVKTQIVLFLTLAGALTGFARQAVQPLPLAEARAQIGTLISRPAALTGVIRRLTADEQVSFLSDVNAALEKMPGSAEEKAAAFLNINRAALKGAAKGNTAALLAEVFATVPPSAMTLLNERFAADLFNRAADASRAYSDAEYTFIATNMLAKIVARTAGSDDAGVRGAFAALMFVRASNGSPAGLSTTLLAQLSDGGVREQAQSDWFPAALATPANYDSMLAYANAAEQPNVLVALRLAGPQILDAMLADLTAGAVDPAGRTATPLLDRTVKHFGESQVNYPDPEKLIGFGEEPRMYQWQRN